jgi:hypothetical protein
MVTITGPLTPELHQHIIDHGGMVTRLLPQETDPQRYATGVARRKHGTMLDVKPLVMEN